MSARRATIMVLLPGRNALSFASPRSPSLAILGAVLLPLLTGMSAERCFRTLRNDGTGHAASASLARVQFPRAHAPKPRGPRVMRVLGNPDLPPDVIATCRTEAKLLTSTARGLSPQPIAASLAATIAPSIVDPAAVVSVKSVLQAIAGHRRVPSADELLQVPANGWLRLQALHLGEELNVRPFDDAFAPNPAAFAEIDHALRCRITGTEIHIDPRLVSILVRLHTLYGRPVQLVSGHRQPNTIGTKKTSQHALGRAADVRIAGVSIEELKRVAIGFGARGVGLYPEKGFVHLDVRQKNRYYWVYTGAGGEQPDMGMARPRPAAGGDGSSADADSEDSNETDSEADSEADSDSHDNGE